MNGKVMWQKLLSRAKAEFNIYSLKANAFLLKWVYPQFLSKVSFVVLGLCAFFISYIFYLLFFPMNSFEIKKIYPLEKNEYVTGDLLKIKMDYCKKNSNPVNTKIQFVDGVLVPSFSVDMNLESGCHSYIYNIAVPNITHDSKYYVQITLTYRVNQIRADSIAFHTSTFHVTVNGDILSRIEKLEEEMNIATSSSNLLPLEERVSRIENTIIRSRTQILYSPAPTPTPTLSTTNKSNTSAQLSPATSKYNGKGKQNNKQSILQKFTEPFLRIFP